MRLGTIPVLGLVLLLPLLVLVLRDRRVPLAWRREVVSGVLTILSTCSSVQAGQRATRISAWRWLGNSHVAVVDRGTSEELCLGAITGHRVWIVFQSLARVRWEHSGR